MFGWYCLAGAATGGSHLGLLETDRTFRQRMAIYGIIFTVGILLLVLGVVLQCSPDDDTGAKSCTVRGVLDGLAGCLAGFAMSMGCVGVIANCSRRNGSSNDSDRNYFDTSMSDEGISLSSSYEPISPEESNLL